MGLYAFTANVSSAILSSALPNLVTAWLKINPHGPPTGIVSFTSLTQLIAVNNLMLGCSNIWWVPLGNTFGRRPVILVCLLVLTASSIWCGEAKSFNSLLAARVIQGQSFMQEKTVDRSKFNLFSQDVVVVLLTRSLPMSSARSSSSINVVEQWPFTPSFSHPDLSSAVSWAATSLRP